MDEPEEPVPCEVPPWEQRVAEAFREQRQSWGPILAASVASDSSSRCGFGCDGQPQKDDSSPSCGAARRTSWALRGGVAPPSGELPMNCDDTHRGAASKVCGDLGSPIVHGSPHWLAF